MKELFSHAHAMWSRKGAFRFELRRSQFKQ
jgi:hypothetical protein